MIINFIVLVLKRTYYAIDPWTQRDAASTNTYDLDVTPSTPTPDSGMRPSTPLQLDLALERLRQVDDQ